MSLFTRDVSLLRASGLMRSSSGQAGIWTEYAGTDSTGGVALLAVHGHRTLSGPGPLFTQAVSSISTHFETVEPKKEPWSVKNEGWNLHRSIDAAAVVNETSPPKLGFQSASSCLW